MENEVKTDGEVLGEKRNPLCFVEVDGDIAAFNIIGASAKTLFPVVKDVIYPNTNAVEEFDGVKPSKWTPIDPEYLTYIHDYVGLRAYAEPVCCRHTGRNIDGEEVVDEAPYQFTYSDKDGVVKRATIMPLRV